MIKLICFDLDSVLIEAKKIHYDALNDALPQEYKISWEEHLAKYDGLKTNDKLNLLKKSDEFEKNKIINFLLKTETKLIENKLLFNIYIALLRSFELLLRIIKIH